MTFAPGDKVRCIDGAHGDHGARVKTGQTYTVSMDANPQTEMLWIEGQGRWAADRFELVERAAVTGPVEYHV